MCAVLDHYIIYEPDNNLSSKRVTTVGECRLANGSEHWKEKKKRLRNTCGRIVKTKETYVTTYNRNRIAIIVTRRINYRRQWRLRLLRLYNTRQRDDWTEYAIRLRFSYVGTLFLTNRLLLMAPYKPNSTERWLFDATNNGNLLSESRWIADHDGVSSTVQLYAPNLAMEGNYRFRHTLHGTRKEFVP